MSKGVAKLNYTLPIGSNSISAVFNAVGYNSSSATKSIVVEKSKLKMTADIVPYMDSAFVNVSFNGTVNGTVFIDLGYKNYSVKSVNGLASINLTDLNIGKNNITISFIHAQYESNDVNSSFDVVPKGTYTVLSILSTVYNSGKAYKVKLLDEDGNPLSGRKLECTLNNSTETLKTNKNGEASLNISLKTGNYTFKVTFSGEKMYLASSNSSLITVNTSVIPLYSKYTYGSKYSVKLLDKNMKPLNNTNITIVFAGKTYNVETDSKGIARINNTLKAGNYTVKITNPNTLEVKSHKIKVVARIDKNNNLTMYYGAGKYYKVRVLDNYGNIAKNVSVKFTVNGKTYYRRTNDSGYASLKIGLKPKTYTISASYKGFTVKNKVIVKPTVITKNITKKKATTIKFTAKLVNSKGTILKYKYITFKFKSKKYKRKTTAKGIATLSLKNLKKGKYVIYSSYGSLTVKNTIKVT